MQRLKSSLAIFGILLIIVQTCSLYFAVINVSAQNEEDIIGIYEEHPIEDVDFWMDYYNDFPQIANRIKFRGGYARYIYDRSSGQMAKRNGFGGHEGMDVPIEYSVYGEDGSLIQSADVWPEIPNPPSTYFDAIPMDYECKFWWKTGDELSGRKMEAMHETANDPESYIPGYSFKDESDQETHMWASGEYISSNGPHYGDMYNELNWGMQYYYDIRIVSKDYWPIEYVEKTYYVPDDAKEDIGSALADRSVENEIHNEFWNTKEPDVPTGQGGSLFYETILSGKRTFVEEYYSDNRYIEYGNECRHPDTDEDPDKDNSYYTYHDITHIGRQSHKEYYVIDDLEGLPGYYYCIYISIKDSYYEDSDSSCAADKESSYIVSEYARLKPIVTERLVNELAALTPTASFTAAEGGNVQEETTQAKAESGEDSGTGINDNIISPRTGNDGAFPAAVSVGVGGAIAAGAAIAASGSGKGKSNKKSKKKEKPKSYKMFVYKDFGDAIKKGAAPVIVRARIMEIVEGGTRKPRIDLTNKISVIGDGLQIGSVTMNGMWMDAEVYTDEQNPGNKGTVIFTFTGEGGTFINRVVFRLVGKPYIVYPDTDLTSTEMVLRMMTNDTEKYSVRFFFEDAVDEPKKLLLSAGDRFETATRAAENVRTYYVDVTSRPTLESADTYISPQREYIGIHAEFNNGDVVDGGFYVEIWPEGLSVTSRHLKNDKLEIDTVANPEAGDLDYKIRPTDFEVRLAYRDKASGNVVFLTGEHIKPRFSDLYEVEKYGNTFKGNFRYTIDTQFDLYAFEPQDTLPMLYGPYEVMIDIECEADGETYTMPMPLCLYGVKPLLPSNAEWQDAYKKLKQAVEVFGISSDMWIRTMIREAKTMSAGDVMFIRNYIVICGTRYYEKERREYAEIDDVMSRYIVVASAMVKIGDKAVELAIMLKWPNADASIIAAFINPWKNALAEFIGQYVARFSLIDLAEGDPEEFDFIKTMLDSCESGLQEIFTSEEVMVEPKTGGKIVSLYMMVCFAKHYFYGEGNEKGDIFKSVLETFKDLTMVKLKAYFTDLIKKTGSLLGKATDFVGKHFSKVLRYVGYEKGLELSKLALENQVRLVIRNSGELSNAAYKAAKEIGKTVMDQNMDSVGKQLSEAGAATAKWTAEYGLAAIINYIAKGTKKESECYGLTTPEALVELGVDRGEDLLKLLSEVIKEKTDIDIMKYYIDAKKTVNDALDVSAKLDGEFLIMSFYGYTVVINIVENAEALLGLAYEICFGWMEDLWKSMQDNEPVNDPRDEIPEDTSVVERMAERVRDLGASAEISYKDN